MFSSYYLTKGAYHERINTKQRRKLKVLCLHGHNGSAKVMEHQMRHFRQVFSEVMDFVVIDAPFPCADPPMKELKRFLEHPNQTFRSWLVFYQDLAAAEQAVSSPDIVSGLEEVVDYLVKVLNGPDGPFDGVLCFS